MYSMQKHSFKKVYDKKKTVVTQPAHASAPASGSFMGDARRSTRMSSTVPSFAPQVKKLNWFQRNILCMNVDIRRGQYEAYRREENILKHLPRLPDDPPASALLSYDKWNEGSSFPWAQVEHHLLETAPARPAYAPEPPTADDSEEDSDGTEGSGEDDDAEDAESSDSE